MEPAGRSRQLADLSGLAGSWRSTDAATHGLAGFDVAVRDGWPWVAFRAAGAAGPVDWREQRVEGLFTDGVTSGRAVGFVVSHRGAGAATRIHATLKQGVAVLGVFFKPAGSGGGSFFREFLARSAPLPEPPAAAGPGGYLGDGDLDLSAGRGTVDPAIIQGRWRNNWLETRGVVEVAVESRDRGTTMRLVGAGPEGPLDWGETDAELYACREEDDVASVSALASYDFGFMAAEVQVRQNKGVLAVTTFNRFKDDSGRHDYVTRELFHRAAK